MSYPSESIERISDFIFLPNSEKDADLIFVLGSGYLPTMDTAAELYNKKRAPLVLITGRCSSKESQPKESECYLFKNRGIELGIPEDHILIEPNASNTKENILFSKELLEARGLLPKIKTILFVCQNFHTRRVLMTSNAVFGNSITPLFYSVNDSRDIQKDNWWLTDIKRNRVLEEMRRITEYSVKGDISLTPY
jgi:uncharacterized SAM-binding protein YcdF (DUF218 family)